MKHIVYRVQDANCHGPYMQDVDGLKELVEAHDDDEVGHPSFCDDELWEYDQFAFESTIKLPDWFNDDERELLKKCGFYIAIYKAESIEHSKSGKQCCFNVKESELIGGLDITSNRSVLHALRELP